MRLSAYLIQIFIERADCQYANRSPGPKKQAFPPPLSHNTAILFKAIGVEQQMIVFANKQPFQWRSCDRWRVTLYAFLVKQS